MKETRGLPKDKIKRLYNKDESDSEQSGSECQSALFEVDPRDDFRDIFFPDGDENKGPELPDTDIEIDLDRISGLLRSQFE